MNYSEASPLPFTCFVESAKDFYETCTTVKKNSRGCEALVLLDPLLDCCFEWLLPRSMKSPGVSRRTGSLSIKRTEALEPTSICSAKNLQENLSSFP